MRKRTGRSLAGALMSVLAVVSLVATLRAQTKSRPDALIVLNGGTNVRFTEDYEGTVKYALRASFPGDAIIDAIKNRLADQGWTPSNFSAVDQQLPTSHLDGWGKYLDGDDLVHIWSGEWNKPDGHNVLYSLSFRFTVNDKGVYAPNDRLEVIGIVMSAEMIKAQRKAHGTQRSQ